MIPLILAALLGASNQLGITNLGGTPAGAISSDGALSTDLNLNGYDVHGKPVQTADSLADHSSISAGQHAYWGATTDAKRKGGNTVIGAGIGASRVQVADFSGLAGDTLDFYVITGGDSDNTSWEWGGVGPSLAGVTSNAEAALALKTYCNANLPPGVTACACADGTCSTAIVGIIPANDTTMLDVFESDSDVTVSYNRGGDIILALAASYDADSPLLCLDSWCIGSFQINAYGTGVRYFRDTVATWATGAVSGRSYFGLAPTIMLRWPASDAFETEADGAALGRNATSKLIEVINTEADPGFHFGNAWAGGSRARLTSPADASISLINNAGDAGARVISSANKLLVAGLASATTPAMIHSYAKTITTADSGADVDPAPTTINPADANAIILDCDDDDGCTGTITETAATAGMVSVLIGLDYATTIADSAGVIELAGGISAILSTGDTLTIIYNGAAWLETSRSDN